MPDPVYQESTDGITAEQLGGFFVGWPDPPSPENHLRILHGSFHVVLALDAATNAVVGFVTAISDGVSCAYIPYLEVLPAYQGQGMGTELMRRILVRLESLYMVDLSCDPASKPFYEQFEMRSGVAMMQRNYNRQSCQSDITA